jgi:hypothetical protein
VVKTLPAGAPQRRALLTDSGFSLRVAEKVITFGEAAARVVGMKHDFATSTDKADDDRFIAWLEAETIADLRRTHGDGEGTKTMIFLFVNRAFEAHMPENLIGETFGKCIVRAGYREEDEGRAFDILEFLGGIARAAHSRR